MNPNKEIDGATWDTYRKTHATWAVKLPVDVTIPTREGVVEGEAGEYLCIDSDGGLYPCDADTFEQMYEPTGGSA
ncbi:hypothetical protein [Haloarcula sp. CGMCC 1.6347]|uniref:hypothetical protein n=1 Tax=Haloarcula sp. CGMCC 1.6347 TaxID=3111455 RepID=UPI00300EB209